MNEKILNYFNFKSSSYNTNSSRGFWKIVRKWEAESVHSLLDKSSHLECLDLGCGSGFYSNKLKEWGANNITCVDISEQMLNEINLKDAIKINANIENFLIDKKFDTVIVAGALEFVKNPLLVIQNVEKMLKPKGVIVLLLPRDSFLGKIYQKFHKKNGFNINLFSKIFLNKIEKETSLKIKKSIKTKPFSICVALSFDK
jgi:2-polyprenyl-3-methyl-5-hydroxy-6-metoxy-1,4-benzoquinol methylase